SSCDALLRRCFARWADTVDACSRRDAAWSSSRMTRVGTASPAQAGLVVATSSAHRGLALQGMVVVVDALLVVVVVVEALMIGVVVDGVVNTVVVVVDAAVVVVVNVVDVAVVEVVVVAKTSLTSRTKTSLLPFVSSAVKAAGLSKATKWPSA